MFQIPVRVSRRRNTLWAALAAAFVIASSGGGVLADGGGGGGGGVGGGLSSLKGVPVPQPANLSTFVKDTAAAIRLGKALLWDIQVGGDGDQACATCHNTAGSDHQAFNTINPKAAAFPLTGDLVNGPGQMIFASDFPFGTGQVGLPYSSSIDVTGSNGLVAETFGGIDPGSAQDVIDLLTPITTIFGSYRQVTGRNAPTYVNAVFNVVQFWDRRANQVFNGSTPFGGTGTALVANGNTLGAISVAIQPASLASQGVGPPNNGVEMSYNGRTFPQLGRKMLSLRPLAKQTVAPDDSVLGPLADTSNGGLKTTPTNTYKDMVQAAFQDRFWNSSVPTPEGFTLMEANFSLFMGLALQLYEATQVSDDSPFDRFASGTGTLSPSAQLGLNVFTGKGRCNQCHSGPVFTAATQLGGNAFTNTGVRPVAQDGGQSLVDPGKANEGCSRRRLSATWS